MNSYIQTNLFASARSILPNFDNLIYDDKLSLIVANAGMISNSAKTCHQIHSKRRLLMVNLSFYITFYQLIHIFVLTITSHIVIIYPTISS